jgi:hypothetical protein
MRIALASLVLLSACGNWSNEDLEFLYALPDKEQLKAELTGMTSTGQGLRRDPLSVGDDSTTGQGAVKAATDFNAFLDGVLAGIDGIKLVPPTTRQDDARTWGPYRDQKNPGFEAKFEIHRLIDGNYTWQYQLRPIGGEFFTAAQGFFEPTASLRKGRGNFTFDAKTVRENLGGGMPGDPDSVRFDYDTTENKIVSLKLVFPVLMMDYRYKDNADKAANMSYRLTGGPDGPFGTENGWKTLEVSSGWVASGAGRATATVTEGANAGAGWTECWDAAFKVVYSKQEWTGGAVIGSQSACVTVPQL